MVSGKQEIHQCGRGGWTGEDSAPVGLLQPGIDQSKIGDEERPGEAGQPESGHPRGIIGRKTGRRPNEPETQPGGKPGKGHRQDQFQRNGSQETGRIGLSPGNEKRQEREMKPKQRAPSATPDDHPQKNGQIRQDDPAQAGFSHLAPSAAIGAAFAKAGRRPGAVQAKLPAWRARRARQLLQSRLYRAN